ncbi:hypothetical protein B0H13DRAFT_2335701 [Mycena leptocephala]|nr:hypothetical protein B0H13DRAFT_2335701 [Mycena leptocephala]
MKAEERPMVALHAYLAVRNPFLHPIPRAQSLSGTRPYAHRISSASASYIDDSIRVHGYVTASSAPPSTCASSSMPVAVMTSDARHWVGQLRCHWYEIVSCERDAGAGGQAEPCCASKILQRVMSCIGFDRRWPCGCAIAPILPHDPSLSFISPSTLLCLVPPPDVTTCTTRTPPHLPASSASSAPHSSAQEASFFKFQEPSMHDSDATSPSASCSPQLSPAPRARHPPSVSLVITTRVVPTPHTWHWHSLLSCHAMLAQDAGWPIAIPLPLLSPFVLRLSGRRAIYLSLRAHDVRNILKLRFAVVTTCVSPALAYAAQETTRLRLRLHRDAIRCHKARGDPKLEGPARLRVPFSSPPSARSHHRTSLRVIEESAATLLAARVSPVPFSSPPAIVFAGGARRCGPRPPSSLPGYRSWTVWMWTCELRVRWRIPIRSYPRTSLRATMESAASRTLAPLRVMGESASTRLAAPVPTIAIVFTSGDGADGSSRRGR